MSIDYSEVLDHTERNILHLKMQGKNHAEVAHILGCRKSHVTMICRDLRNKLHAANDAMMVARYLGWRGLEDE